MAVAPPGDIVLDVIRAADPDALETARARLASFATGNPASGSFEVATAPQARMTPATTPSNDPTADAFVRFESMVLQTFIQSMLPQDAESYYGEGIAGQMWQSLLAEQLGESMARRGGIGIADRVLRDYYVDGEQRVPLQGVSHDPNKADADTQHMLSLGLVQEIQRKVAQGIGQDRAAMSGVTIKQ